MPFAARGADASFTEAIQHRSLRLIKIDERQIRIEKLQTKYRRTDATKPKLSYRFLRTIIAKIYASCLLSVV